jgi:hypothetical protein
MRPTKNDPTPAAELFTTTNCRYGPSIWRPRQCFTGASKDGDTDAIRRHVCAASFQPLGIVFAAARLRFAVARCVSISPADKRFSSLFFDGGVMMKKRFAFLFAGIAICGLAAAPLAGQEIEDQGPYYEDDAWYDISEWFDGNDYNPTDETIGEIDDESYDVGDDTGADLDSDWYGYDDRYDDDDWFYDYYDDGYPYYYDTDDNPADFEYSHRYYDYDGDGLYDAYYRYHDNDGDGFYEVVSYFTFNDVADREQTDRSSQQNPESAKQHRVSGEITKTKKVSVADTRHMVAVLRTSAGNQAIVDLGPVRDIDQLDLEKGDKLTVHGPSVKIGQRKTILAKKVSANGRTQETRRSGKTMTGRIVNTRTAEVRGKERQIAVVETNGKHRLVDLGPANRLEMELDKGAKVTVTGVPVKVGDKRVLIAHEIEHGQETASIERGTSSR